MKPARIGMLTPSSNTVLEPLTAAMLSDLPDVTAHFGRFKVTEIALSQSALGQFGADEILRAAMLLADAKVDVIAWNGTSAAWMGFGSDERLCRRIEDATGIAARTSVLAFRDAFRRNAVSRVGLVTPYTDDVQAKIIANWNAAGIVCAAERHCGLRDNYSFADVTPERIAALVREVAAEGCDSIAIVCTNMRGASIAAGLERDLGVTIYDSIALTLRDCLVAIGIDPSHVKGWGRLFALS